MMLPSQSPILNVDSIFTDTAAFITIIVKFASIFRL